MNNCYCIWLHITLDINAMYVSWVLKILIGNREKTYVSIVRT